MGAAQVAQLRRTVTRNGKKTVEVVYLRVRAGMPDCVGHPASPGGTDAQGPGRGPGGAAVIGVGNQPAGSRRL
jgi:hypothetical protein